MYGSHLLCHFIDNDTNNARLLWKRIPPKFKDKQKYDNKPLLDTWDIGKCLLTKDYEKAWPLIEKFNWGDDLNQLMGIFKDVYRERMLNLIGKAYISIETTTAKNFLGLAKEEGLQEYVKSKGMTTGDGFVYPGNVGEKPQFVMTKDRINGISDIV